MTITLQPGYFIQCLTRLRVMQPGNCGSIWGRVKKFCSSAQHLNQWVEGALSPRVKRLAHEGDHTRVCSAEFKNNLSPWFPSVPSWRAQRRLHFFFFTPDIYNKFTAYFQFVKVDSYCVVQVVMKLRKTDLLLNYTEQEEMLPNCSNLPNVVFYYLANEHPILFLTFIFYRQKLLSFFSCLALNLGRQGLSKILYLSCTNNVEVSMEVYKNTVMFVNDRQTETTQ
jgi:hypothetical protein